MKLFESDKRFQSNRNEINIVVGVQCYGERIQDIDIVILGKCEDFSIKINSDNVNIGKNQPDERNRVKTIPVRNFAITIEEKSVTPDQVYLEGTHLRIKGRTGTITSQSEGQKYSLKNYFENNGIKKAPWIDNFILFSRFKEEQFSLNVKGMNVVFNDMTLETLFDTMYHTQERHNRVPFSTPYFPNEWQKMLALLTKKIQETELDSIKFNKICKEQIFNQNFIDKLGNKLLIFQGYGGTGKTVILLNLAYSIFDRYKKRVLILTYNNSLIQDIRRLLAIMRIPMGDEETIQIWSIYSFWGKILYLLGLNEEYDENDPEVHMSKIKDMLYTSSMEQNVASKLKEMFEEWDYIMVDEGQDWSENERDALYRLFTHRKIIVADGKNQMVRNTKPCHWELVDKRYNGKGRFDDKELEIIPLEKSLRHKPNITYFVSELSKKFNWDFKMLENDQYKDGGGISILEGPYTKNVHDTILRKNKEKKNENIDLLFAIPPSYVKTDAKNERYSTIGEVFSEWGYKIFDGVDKNIRRDKFPTELEQLRIFQYDSCRGLEGWIIVNIAFDEFYDYKLSEFKDYAPKNKSKSDAQKKEEFIVNWLLIPLTRGIDSIVIHLTKFNHPLSMILYDIYQSNEDLAIEWFKFENGEWVKRSREKK